MPVRAEECKHVLVLHTGGTIGMKRNENGVFAPFPNVLPDKITNDPDTNSAEVSEFLQLPGLTNNVRILYKIKEYNPLLDSSNMSTESWAKIAKDIGDEYENWDGFVVLHGTDTLAYTASALSFMLKGLQKPVILTGAQIPIFEVGTDAKTNFLASVRFAASDNINEVCVCFANKLLRGNRTVKSSSESIEAFTTPNYHTLGDVGGVGFKVHNQFIWSDQQGCQNFTFNLNKNIVILRIFPTMTPEMLRYILKSPTEGVVLLSYGVGNIPNNPEFGEALRDAVHRGVIIVNLTQCMRGTVSFVYEAGEILESLGIIPGYDMTVEAAFAKLSYVLGLPVNHREKVEMMMTNICGELTK